MSAWIGLNCLRICFSGGVVSTKCSEFLDQLSDSQSLSEDSLQGVGLVNIFFTMRSQVKCLVMQVQNREKYAMEGKMWRGKWFLPIYVYYLCIHLTNSMEHSLS